MIHFLWEYDAFFYPEILGPNDLFHQLIGSVELSIFIQTKAPFLKLWILIDGLFGISLDIFFLRFFGVAKVNKLNA